jgi:hypothetical protein
LLRTRAPQDSQYGGSARDPIADFHAHINRRIEDNIHARPELNKAHALSADETVAGPRIEDDSASQQSSDLLEGDCLSFSIHRYDVLFVRVR